MQTGPGATPGAGNTSWPWPRNKEAVVPAKKQKTSRQVTSHAKCMFRVFFDSEELCTRPVCESTVWRYMEDIGRQRTDKGRTRGWAAMSSSF